MQPLSTKKRNRLFLTFGVVFLVALPFLVLYATGFRFSERSLIKTGGLYVHKSLVTEVTITLNEKPLNEKFTSFLQRYYFVQSLREGDYEIHAEKEDYHSWKKSVPILSQRITEVAPFLIPTEPLFEEIPEKLETTKTDESTTITNPIYTNIVKSFNEKAIAWRAATREYEEAKETYDSLIEELEVAYEDEEGVNVEELLTIEKPRKHLQSQQKIEIWQDELTGNIFTSLQENSGSLPYFCDEITTCTTPQMVVEISTSYPFEFFPGRNDVVLYSNESGLFAAEIDTRSTQHVFPVYLGEDIDFVVENDDTIYVKDGDMYLAWEVY